MSTAITRSHQLILAALTRHKVEFVLVGGVGAQAYGWTDATADVDIAIATDPANTGRVDGALAELDARLVGVGELGSVFDTNAGRLEFVRKADGIGDFHAWMQSAQVRELAPNLTVTVAHPADILRSKQASNRAKDLDVLPRMRRDLIAAGDLDPEEIDGPIAEPPTTTPTPAGYLNSMLGERPADRARAALWDRAAELVTDYRERHNVTDPDHPLGTRPAPSDHRHDHDSVQAAVDRTRRMLERADRDRTIRGPDRGPDRGPF